MKTIQKTLYVFMLVCLLVVVGCSRDDNSGDQDEGGLLTQEELHRIENMIVQIIRDSGRDFPQYDQPRQLPAKRGGLDPFLEGPNNYLETINQPGELKLRLWLDDEGNIIPSPTWQENNPNYCSDEGRNMRAAHKMLEFKVMYDPEFGISNPDQFAYGVQLNLIEIGTTAIKESVWVDPIIDNSNNWINATLNSAWEQMLVRATIGGAIGPCEGTIENSYPPHTYDLTIDGQRYVGEVENVALADGYSGMAFTMRENGLNQTAFSLAGDEIGVTALYEYPDGQEGNVPFDEDGEQSIFVITLAASANSPFFSYSGNSKLTIGEKIPHPDGTSYFIELKVEFEGVLVYTVEGDDHPVPASGTIKINLPPIP